METVGITACSNPLKASCREENQALKEFLEQTGKKVRVSPCIYERPDQPFYSGKQRAEALTELFSDPEVRDIYDISGGDMGNEILDDLDFQKIRRSSAIFWGYSDLTTVLNAIYAKTGKWGVLYSARNLVHEDSREEQQRRYLEGDALFGPSFHMVQGDSMEGTVVGGNIRCFLKLAGTDYFPDLRGKLLLLEARSGQVPQMITYLSQLKSMGAFQKVKGILLGTFSEMEKMNCRPDILTLVKSFAGEKIPIAKTEDIGHGHDSRAIRIGAEKEISG